MKKEKFTERQQIEKWIKEDNLLDDSEEVLNEVFEIAMYYKENHPNVTLMRAYTYAYIVYVNNTIESR